MTATKSGAPWMLLLLILVLGVGLTSLGLILFQGAFLRGGTPERGEKELRIAALLGDKALYAESAKAYERAILDGDLSPAREANACYILGLLYMDHLSQYENALTWFYRAQTHEALDEDSRKESDRRIVSCLETLGRSRDAKLELERATTLGSSPTPSSSAGRVVAKVGSRQITEGEIDQALQRLPSELRQRYEDEAGRQDFIAQFVASEVVCAAACRKGLDKDPEVLLRTEEFRKELITAQYLEDELKDKVSLSPQDVQLYYQAHPEDFPGKTFEQVQEEVAQRLMLEKNGQVTQELLSRLMKAEEAEIYSKISFEEGERHAP